MNEHDLAMRAGCIGGTHLRGEDDECAYCAALRAMRATWPSMVDDALQPAADLIVWAKANMSA